MNYNFSYRLSRIRNIINSNFSNSLNRVAQITCGEYKKNGKIIRIWTNLKGGYEGFDGSDEELKELLFNTFDELNVIEYKEDPVDNILPENHIETGVLGGAILGSISTMALIRSKDKFINSLGFVGGILAGSVLGGILGSLIKRKKNIEKNKMFRKENIIGKRKLRKDDIRIVHLG